MKRPPNNITKPAKRVLHASLPRVNNESHYRVKCLECSKGILPVVRDTNTLKLLRNDRCLLCGQSYIYLDENINGESLVPALELN